MRRLLIAAGAAALLTIALVATVAAAGPQGRHGVAAQAAGAQSDVVADILGLTRDAIDDLRHDGLSLAQIAEQQKVDPQKLIDALVAEWTARIEARVTAGALSTEQATELKAQLETRARDMVYRTTLGGMRGAAVGAGPVLRDGSGAGNGSAPGDGTGYRGGRGAGNGAGPADGTGTRGANRGGGNGTCDGTGAGTSQP
jgi:lambda repressor-like predicted transcriptional regulator